MILVTGGSGLLGRQLIQTLVASGKQVRAIVNKNPLPPIEGLQSFKADILDVVALEEAMQDITHVYHCAGLVSFDPSDKDRLYKINVEGTANMLQAAMNAGVQRFVHVSSVAALGRLRKNEEVNESMQWEKDTSNSIYGHSKFLGEMEVWRAMAEGLPAVIINPSIIIGPGNWNESSLKIFKTVYKEFPWFTEGVNGVVDVKDVANAMIMLMNEEVTEERYIISGHNVSYKDLFTNIARAFGKKPPTKPVTPFMANLVWRIEKIKSLITGASPLLTKETTATAFARVYYNNTKFLTAFPNFSYTPLHQTIDETVKSLQQKLNKP